MGDSESSHDAYLAMARRIRRSGGSIEEALGELRRAGSSAIDAVKVVRELESVPLAEAKVIVDASQTWRDMRDVNRELRLRILRAVEADEAVEAGLRPEIETVLELAKGHPDADFVGPQPVAFIDAAEERLGLVFPDTYRRFLIELGAGNVGPDDIYGVFRMDFDASGIPDVVGATLDGRATLGLPEAAVLIGYDGGEGKIVLDVSRKQMDGSVPVVWWHPGLPLNEAPAMASDFSTYQFEIVTRED